MRSQLFHLALFGALLHAAPAGLAEVRAFVGAQLIPVAGDPFEYTSHVIGNVIEGRQVSDTVR
jgi:hypothetical protein